MHRTRRRRLAGILGQTFLYLAALTSVVGSGCEQKPDAPVWDNPFDPSGSGDPFHLRAVMAHNAVVVIWDRPDVPSIAAYEILRSLDGAEYSVAGQAPSGATSFNDIGFSPNHINYYKVQVLNQAGDVSAVSRVAAAEILTAPWLEIAGGATTVPTPQVILTIRTDAGDTLELAATSDFAGSVRFPASPGETDTLAWDLGPATADLTNLYVWLRVHTGPVVSPVAHDSVKTFFNPDLQLEGHPVTVATRRQTAVVSNIGGLTQMRFALSSAGLDSAAWVAADSIAGGNAYFTGDLLGPDSTAQMLYGEFQCDFGYTDVDSLRCVPDSLEGAHFVLADGDTLTEVATVQLVSSALATEMRFAEIPDLSAVPWQAYSDTTSFTLSAGGGPRTVYGQFRNDWYSAVARDSIFFIDTGGAPAR